jgi:hypothetical protein
MEVFVATIPTYYETMAVATTEAEARRLVAKEAYEYLKAAKALRPETSSPAKCAEYFGVTVTVVKVGSATIVA